MTALPDVATPLAEDEAEAAFAAMLDGRISDEETARVLVALSDRGETGRCGRA
jgi:anthranilate phosphoribosyltransferase